MGRGVKAERVRRVCGKGEKGQSGRENTKRPHGTVIPRGRSRIEPKDGFQAAGVFGAVETVAVTAEDARTLQNALHARMYWAASAPRPAAI